MLFMYPHALTHGRKTRIDRNDNFNFDRQDTKDNLNRKFVTCMFGRKGEKDRTARQISYSCLMIV